jgi:hypothetical protein
MTKPKLNVELLAEEIEAATACSVAYCDATEAVRELLADGMRFRMLNNEPPVHPYFVMKLSPPAVAKQYMQFLEAVADRAGVVGPSGKAKSDFRFVQLPAGGKWEACGLDGAWQVLNRSFEPTPDGYRQAENSR